MDFEVIDFEKYREENDDTYGKEPEKKPAKKPKRDNKKVFGVIGAALVVVIALLSPIFGIKEVETTEMIAYNESEILDIGGIKYGNNIFLTSFMAEGKLEENPYFKSVNVKASFPNKVVVEVEERRVRGYVSYMGSYLYIDEYGLVMDSKTNFKENLPVFTGLDFDKFKVGEILEIEDEKALETVVLLTQSFTRHEALDKVDSVDVKDVRNVIVTAGGVTVKLGDMDDIDRKIKTMREILKEIGEDERGTLDISDLSKPLIFKYLT